MFTLTSCLRDLGDPAGGTSRNGNTHSPKVCCRKCEMPELEMSELWRTKSNGRQAQKCFARVATVLKWFPFVEFDQDAGFHI